MHSNNNSKTTLQDFTSLRDTIVKQLQSHLALLDKQALFIGIHTGGLWLAKDLQKQLNIDSQLGELDISFYRDDFAQNGLNPQVKPSVLPFEIENAHIILVDDIVMTGRTIRAALNEIFDYGRPKSVTLVSLIELNSRELPIQADIYGQKLSLLPSQRVELLGPEPLRLQIVEAA